MARERYLTPETAEALKRRSDQDAQSGFAITGPWLDVLFVASATQRDVSHGLGVVPTGYEIILEVGGTVRGSNITGWTTELAFLQADTANTRARLRFVKTPQEPINA